LNMLELQTQVQFKNILFATDFSPAAATALPYAATLARVYGSKIWAFHLAPPTVNPMTDPSSWAVLEKAAKARREEERKILLNSFNGLEPEVLIEEGDLWSVLSAAIKAHNIDLIVMGTHGRTGVGKVLMGSVAEEILRQSPCPVLTVNPHSSVEAKHAAEITRILFATTLRPESLAAAPYAISLAQEFQTYLTLLHVIEDPKTGDLVRWPELQASSMRLLQNAVPPEAQRRFLPDYVVERGDPAEKILALARTHGVNLIVLGVHEAVGVPGAATHLSVSVAHKVVSHAQCPVLTVRT